MPSEIFIFAANIVAYMRIFLNSRCAEKESSSDAELMQKQPKAVVSGRSDEAEFIKQYYIKEENPHLS